jgi:FMN phosphatase YigB (HAD superfamily)
MTAPLRSIIWDLDNCLYTKTHALEEAIIDGLTHALYQHGIPLPIDQIRQTTIDSWYEHGCSIAKFHKELGFKIHPSDIHHPFCDGLDEKLISPCDTTKDWFLKHNHNNSLTHALITHANQNWAKRTLFHLGIRDFFQEDAIFGYENYHFHSKAESLTGLEMAAKALGTDLKHIVFVEDTYHNLRPAAEAGLRTIFLNYGRDLPHLPDYITTQCHDRIEAFSIIDSWVD